MKKENRHHIISRYGFVIVLIMCLAAAIVYRLARTTVIDASHWNERVSRSLNTYDTIQPRRGNILATDGSILATNLRHYTVRMDFNASRFDSTLYADTIAQLADSMALAFPQRNKKQWQEYLLEPLHRTKKPTGFKVIDNISHADYSRMRTFPFFSIKNSNRNGVVLETNMRRINPYGSMALRSIGRVNKPTPKSNQVHGYNGLEMALDSWLFGEVGYSKKVPLTHGIVNRPEKEPRHGYNILTTIDIKLQDIVENELNSMLEETRADWGVAVLMEVETGNIKAISNLQIDSVTNNYIEGMNRAVIGFEPGSVIKAVSMLIALENGAVTPNQIIATPSPYSYAGGRPIRDCSPVASMPAYEVCERSSNIGMTRIISSKYSAHPGQFYSALKKIGFLEPLGVGIAGERAPKVDSLGTKDLVALSRQCYGYATLVPPMHTLAIYNAIANNGRFVRPRLVQRIYGGDFDSIVPVTYVRDRICSEANARTLRSMLKRVVWGDHGTARVLRNENVEIAGKTGTALDIANKQYTSKTRVSFCGFFPADEPKYSCIVLVSNPRNGAGAARSSGVVLKNVALRMYSRGLLDAGSPTLEKKTSTLPTLYASRTDENKNQLATALGAGNRIKVISRPKATAKGVPSVKGFGLRDAIAALEQAGYNVKVSGSGCVVDQQPAAGSALRTGSTVHLSLRN